MLCLSEYMRRQDTFVANSFNGCDWKLNVGPISEQNVWDGFVTQLGTVLLTRLRKL